MTNLHLEAVERLTVLMSTRGVQMLIGRYVAVPDLDPNVSVHSLRLTSLTAATDRGSDNIGLQDFARHAA